MMVPFRELSTGRGAANVAAAAAAGDSKIFDCNFSGGDVRNTCTCNKDNIHIVLSLHILDLMSWKRKGYKGITLCT
jgi:hypothetical protein